MQDNRICVIVPYYGKWPVFFDLFLKSCVNNKRLEIIFITDLDLPENVPANVKKIDMKFDGIRDFFSRKLDVPVALDSFYKLCDLKPTYGYVFEEYIKDFQFWAFGDIDLIYGDIEKFLPDALLNEYDILTFRTEWLSGSLTIFRNNPLINGLFQQSKDWQKVVSTPKHYSFTECARQYKAVKDAGSIFKVPLEIETMTIVVKRAANEKKIRLFEQKLIKESISPNEYLIFDHGKVINNQGNEFLHYHYITEKSINGFVFPAWHPIPDQFFISRSGFFRDIKNPFVPVISLIRKIKSGKKRLLSRSKGKKKH